MAGVRVDVIQSEIRSSSTYPNFGTSLAQVSAKLRSSRVDRHTSLETTLSVGKLALSVSGLRDTHELREGKSRVNVTGIWHGSPDPSFGKPKEMRVIVGKCPVNIKRNNWLAVIECPMCTIHAVTFRASLYTSVVRMPFSHFPYRPMW